MPSPYPLPRSGRGEKRLSGLRVARLRHELQSHGVHAIPIAGRRRTVRKHVPEMAIAPRTADLGANHSVGRIADLADVLRIERGEKARPTRTGLELLARL